MKRLEKLFMAVALVIGTLFVFGGQLASAATGGDYSDVPKTHAYYDEIMFLKEKGIVKPADKFNPNSSATRQQVVLMIGRSLGLNNTPRASIFKDVNFINEDSGVIQSAYEAGIAKGYPGNILKGSDNVSRGHMAAFIARGFEKQIEVGKYPIQEFKDVHVGTTEYEPIRILTSAGVINGYGDGTFKPNASISRQHVAAMLARALGYKDASKVEGVELKLIELKNSKAILIRTASNAFLIDTGLESDAAELVSKLKALKVSKLEYVVVSEDSPTSYEGLVALHKAIPMGVVFYGGTKENSALATTLATLKANHNVDAALLQKDAFLAIVENSKSQGFKVTEGVTSIFETEEIVNSAGEVSLTLHYNGFKLSIAEFLSNAKEMNIGTYTLK